MTRRIEEPTELLLIPQFLLPDPPDWEAYS
jgi:hypothetical protein